MDVKKPKIENYTEHRPWGYFTVLEESDTYKVKKLVVSPRKRLSLQLHNHRSELWTVVKGTPILTCGKIKKTFDVKDVLFIPLKEIHRIENNTDEETVIIEVQFGDYLGEDDIVRFEDDYFRTL